MSELMPGNNYTQHHKQAEWAKQSKAEQASIGYMQLPPQGRALWVSPLPGPPSQCTPWDFRPLNTHNLLINSPTTLTT